ncbi:MFS transporter [Paraburkholderia sp. RL17-373-BIF-A]|uniref:MFS transporter n=1 Tax=Paraburkholderia sp. RL17-373-BIF-A TaxID=3031629 RepID=UPI0038B7E7F6
MQSLDIAKIIDDGPFGRARLVTVILCFLAVLVDGFDTQAIGYIAPALAADWHVAKSALAPVFASSLAGLMVGAFMFGSISDRKGRKFGLTLSVALFGVFSLMTAMTHSITALLVMRFLTGIGLGGVMPNAVSLTSEYAPSRVRSTVVMVMFCGFSLGAALGGVVSNSLLAHYSWRAVLIVGGLAPLLLAPVLLLALRESIDFMVEKQFPRARIKAALASIAPHALIPENALFERKTSMHARASIGKLFTEGRAALTLLLWIIFFMSLLELYFISNWLPLLLHQTGLDVGHAVMTSSLFQIGGTIGTLMLGRFIDRCKPFFVLGVVYIGAALFVFWLGLNVAGSTAVLSTAILCAGFCVVGGQIAANALAARSYPTAIRATGVGYAFGIGRIGSLVGPFLGGGLIALKWDPAHIFMLGAVPVLIASCAAMVIHSRSRGDYMKSEGRVSGKLEA